MDNIPKIIIYSRNEFRNWLKKNHKKYSKMAVIVHKRHTGKSAPTHRELIEEAICFGWIDTTIKRLDEDTFVRYFSKRNKNSRWSNNTLSYAKKLLEEGKMASEGIHYYKLGLAKPTHDADIPKNPNMPENLEKALNKNKKAGQNFDSFSPSAKRTYYRWLLRAKRIETQNKRIRQIMEAALKKNSNLLGSAQKSNN